MTVLGRSISRSQRARKFTMAASTTPVSISSNPGSLNRNQRYFAMKQAMGQTYKALPRAEADKLKERMSKLQEARNEILQQWKIHNNVAIDRNAIESAWETATRNQFGFMPDDKRRLLASQGFRFSGGSGKFRPYFIDGGILRGGMTAHGKEADGTFAIPTNPGDNRQLTSLQAKYTNPSMYPMTRIIKFIRGRWGEGPTAQEYEGVWPGHKRPREYAFVASATRQKPTVNLITGQTSQPMDQSAGL